MTTTFIELGGVKRPVRFGFEGLYAYEQNTGRKALADFADYTKNAAAVYESAHAEALLAGETPKAAKEIADAAATAIIPMALIINIGYAGLYAGYRKEGIPPDFDEYKVAEWLGENPNAMGEIFSAFTESFPKAEKKTTPRPVTAKAAN